MTSRNTPTRRVSAGRGAVANSSVSATAAGTAPTAKTPTRRRSTSGRLNHTWRPLLANWATVRTATASRVPRTATNTGSSGTPPPNPATADRAAVPKAATTRAMTSSTCSTQGILPPAVAAGLGGRFPHIALRRNTVLVSGSTNKPTIRMMDVTLRRPGPPLRLAGAAGSPRPPGGMRRKREPGGNPGLPRSGERERPPSYALDPTYRVWEATASRCPPTAGRARESEDLPAARARTIARGHPGDLVGGSAYIPGGHRAGERRGPSGSSSLRALVPSPGSQGVISRRRSP